MAAIKFIIVESSNIEEVAHSSQQSGSNKPMADETLIIKFKGGAKYQYSPVSEAMFDNMMQAESLGKWFWQNIRDKPNINLEKL
tara:strand:+ start:25643 stop:25894 length:252 start_codon:yes stop_codon:yes gene_type:complete